MGWKIIAGGMLIAFGYIVGYDSAADDAARLGPRAACERTIQDMAGCSKLTEQDHE